MVNSPHLDPFPMGGEGVSSFPVRHSLLLRCLQTEERERGLVRGAKRRCSASSFVFGGERPRATKGEITKEEAKPYFPLQNLLKSFPKRETERKAIHKASSVSYALKVFLTIYYILHTIYDIRVTAREGNRPDTFFFTHLD